MYLLYMYACLQHFETRRKICQANGMEEALLEHEQRLMKLAKKQK